MPVRETIIEGIQARLANSTVIEPCFKDGDRVQVTEHPFSQFEAIFVATDGDDRVILLLNFLQTEQRASFPLANVRKAR